MRFIVTICIIASLIAVYTVWGRPWLKEQPWMDWWFKSPAGEWVEGLWKKSETILWSRFLVLGGLLPPVLEELEKLNVPALEAILPDELRGWWTLSFAGIGIINELLRNRTSKPIEVVALPEEKPIEVSVAIDRMEDANKRAVAVTQEAKAEGKV